MAVATFLRTPAAELALAQGTVNGRTANVAAYPDPPGAPAATVRLAAQRLQCSARLSGPWANVATAIQSGIALHNQMGNRKFEYRFRQKPTAYLIRIGQAV